MYFKRQTCDELRDKSKVLLLKRDHSNSQTLTCPDDSKQIAPDEKNKRTSSLAVCKNASTESTCVNKAARNIHYDSSRASLEKTPRYELCNRMHYLPPMEANYQR